MGTYVRLTAADLGHRPGDLDRLYPREREIALLVYSRGCVTAREVELAIGGLTNAAVRSMLNRLVKKGLVTRQELKAPNPFVYAPALTKIASQENAILHCADDFFGGSLQAIATALAEYCAAHEVGLTLHRRPATAMDRAIRISGRPSLGTDRAEAVPFAVATAA